MSKTQESKMRFRPITSQNNFPEMEVQILDLWESNDIYKKTQALRAKDDNRYYWLEGPPSANGKPHFGHAITRTLKDVMLRYQTMKGKYVVPRIGGYDCHGLPIEIEVEKRLGINSKQEIEEYGIKEFNEKCRESVLRYVDDWNEMSRRIGFWLDLENSYIMMEDYYIESNWWALKQLYEKDLLYKGVRVSPYCARCGTTLSSHELAQGYKEVTDPAIFIKFKSLDLKDVSYLAWTTTPWTLLSNVMLTVNPKFEYVVVEHEGEKFLLAEELLDQVFKIKDDKDKPKILQRFNGKDLEGKDYEPIFPFFAHLKDKGYAFKVTLAEYVDLESGTGIVHSAPSFGSDDAETGRKYGTPVVNPVDKSGKFDHTVPPLKGMWVKDADKKIIKMLREDNKLFRQETYVHNYPHCWRDDSPLLYYGTESWFIRMSSLRQKMVETNEQVYWQPHHLKRGRFGKFIENVIDWNLSRSRYWGCPLPVWTCNKCSTVTVVGGKSELEELGGQLPEDFELHRPWVDNVKWECDCGGTFVREVYTIDVWFESGAATFSQYHYPFENQDQFDPENPSYDFITEAIDQTRGWFYSLHAISTALFDKPAFKSVLCMEHVLAEDGTKMSKSKGNAVSPNEVFDSIGADPTRWYLCYSPAWNSMRFGLNLIKEAQRRFFNTLWNVYSFFVTNANVDGYNPVTRSKSEDRPELDRWIISRLQKLIQDIDDDYEKIVFHGVTKTLEYFVVEEVSNWYLRRSRRRFYGFELTSDKSAAFDTLFEILVTLARLMAPIIPFMAEELYQNLEVNTDVAKQMSVHMELMPTPVPSLIDEELMAKMDLALLVTAAARAARAHAGIKARQPLQTLLVNFEDDLKSTTKLPNEIIDVIGEEINVKEILIIKDDDEYVEYKVQPLLKVLAPRVKGEIKKIKTYLEQIDRDEAKRIVKSIFNRGSVEVTINEKVWEFEEDELLVHSLATSGYVVGENNKVTVFLKTEITKDLKLEGLARGIVRHIQESRKQANLDYLDRIKVYLDFDSEELAETIKKFKNYISEEVQANVLLINSGMEGEPIKIDNNTVSLNIEKV